MKQESRFGAHIGTSSLLLIFLTLSLVSFGSLSLAGAKADERLSVKLSEHMAEYYAACHEAEAFVARTDRALSEIYSSDPAAYPAQAENVPLSVMIPINDTQQLLVALAPVDPATEGSATGNDPAAPVKGARFCRITKWKVDNLDLESYERHLPVSGHGDLFE